MTYNKSVLVVVSLITTSCVLMMSKATANTGLSSCGKDSMLISQVQGNASHSLFVGKTVSVKAVVTHVLPKINTIYLQEELSDEDEFDNTSEGVAVILREQSLPAINDVVSVTGLVSEEFDRTHIVAASIEKCGEYKKIIAKQLTLPFNSNTNLEHLEGMLVRFEQPLTVSSNYGLGRFGELVLSNGRLYKSTQVYLPGTVDERALEKRNSLNRIILDDDQDGSFQNDHVYSSVPKESLSAITTLRLGDTVENIVGTLDFAFDNYRLRPVTEPTITAKNIRPVKPDIESGNLSVASFNVLNYFTTLEERGADSEIEFERQASKIVNAIAAINADIIGLMEIENNGFKSDSAIFDLVQRLNLLMGDNTYAFVRNPGSTGSHSIKVALIYKPSVVIPTEKYRTLSSKNSPVEQEIALYEDRNRESLAQKFKILSVGEELVVNVNHFKSKGSPCEDIDNDSTTGQGNCNGVRNRAAKALSLWLKSEYANTPTLIIGDLNAYALEDPIVTLANAGFSDLVREFHGPLAYGYSFRAESGSLDYALANEEARKRVVDAIDWNINADEPIALDYNLERKSSAMQSKYYSDDPFRSSDHDPVIVTLNF